MKNEELRKEYAAMSGDAVYGMISKACGAVYSASRRRAEAAWIYAASDLVGEAWIRLDGKLQRGAEADSLEELAVRAADDALRAASRLAERSIGSETGDDGDSADDIGEDKTEHAPATAELVSRPTEAAALAHIRIESIAVDEIDRLIIRSIKAGLKKQDVARAAGIHPNTVTRRLQAMRDRWPELDL